MQYIIFGFFVIHYKLNGRGWCSSFARTFTNNKDYEKRKLKPLIYLTAYIALPIILVPKYVCNAFVICNTFLFHFHRNTSCSNQSSTHFSSCRRQREGQILRVSRKTERFHCSITNETIRIPPLLLYMTFEGVFAFVR